MLFLKNLFIKIIKIIYKHLFIYVLIAYTPLPFLDILNFYNNDFDLESSDNDDSNNKAQEEEDQKKANFYFKLKLIGYGIGIIIIFYIIFTNSPDAAASASASLKNSKASNFYKMQQDKILENRLNNALLTTKKILEIKKNNS